MAPPDAASDVQGTAEGIGPTTSLVLTPRGSAAWIASDVWSGSDYEVRIADSRGNMLLDRGAGIAPTSLHYARGVLTWTHGGMPRSARLRQR